MAGLPGQLQVLLRRRAVRALFAVLCGLAGLGAAFFSRRPVVLVTDSAFTALYGKQRALVRKTGLSLRLFRQVKTAPVAESAGPDLVSLAARTASARPYAVFFPYRYRDGARRYVRDYPDVPSAVLAGRESETPAPAAGAPGTAGDVSGLAWYSTDVLADFYRGGFCAGRLAASAGEILVQAGEITPEQRSALVRGVEAGAGTETGVRFGGAVFPGETACAVFAGGTFFAEAAGTDIPLVLYSWLDPAVMPAGSAVLFSDSPWETLPEALRLLEKGVFAGAVSSVPLVVGEKNAGLSAGRIKKLKFSPVEADN